jgi:hypothetical protein
MNEDKDLATRVAEKEAEIERYKGVLDRAFPSRWYSQGKRHLEDLERELQELMNSRT